MSTSGGGRIVKAHIEQDNDMKSVGAFSSKKGYNASKRNNKQMQNYPDHQSIPIGPNFNSPITPVPMNAHHLNYS